MKNKINITLFFLLNSFLAFADSNQEKFLRACELYKENKLQDAINLFQNLSQNNFGVLHNLGNCFYLLKNYPQAIIYWRKAQLTANSKEYRKLENAIEKTQIQLGIDKPNWHTQLWKFFLLNLSGFSLIFLQIMFFILWILSIYLSIRFYNKKNYLLLFFLILFNVICFMTVVSQLNKKLEGVIIENTDARIGSDELFHKIAPLKAGQDVKILEYRNAWYRISCNGIHGWIPKSGLSLIE